MAFAHRKPYALKASERQPSRAEFRRLIRDALTHLHDPAYLQTHPLALIAPVESGLGRSDLGRNLRRSLLAAIEDLRPDSKVPAGSPPWRSHQILALRYLEALDAARVQDQLALGKSRYFVEQQRALEALVSLLWERWESDGRGERDRVQEAGAATATRIRVLQPRTSPPSNLPHQLTSFVGREREIAAVKRLLGQSRLVTLTGTGGCGKTRLALEVARSLPEDCPDGVWLIDFAPLVDPSLVPQTVASTLGVREQSGKPAVETLVDSSRGSRLLLLLDNCEHLIDASARLAETLLRACPELRVLATSRELLGVPGETTWRVPSLDLPEEGQPICLDGCLDRLADLDSVRLFLDRARQVQPDFSLTPQNAPATVEICRRLDGIPLAIELAAARLSGLAVEEIAARLDDRFSLLTGGSRTALPRQRTLRATVDWSHSLLDEREQALFRRLAVFAGGWTLKAAEMVCEGRELEAGERDRLSPTPILRILQTSPNLNLRPPASDGVLDLLLQLVNKSLVLAESAAGDETRYRVLETIRQYAWEKLAESGEAAEVERAHAEFFLELAEQVRPELEGPRQREWLDRLERERGNLRAALRWLESAGDAENGLRLAIGLFQLWGIRGPLSESRSWLRAFLELPGAKETPLAVDALARLATVMHVESGPTAGRPFAEEALRIARGLGDRRALALALWAMAGTENEHEMRRRYLSEALPMSREVGNQELSASCLRRLGLGAWSTGDLVIARAQFEESLDIYRSVGGTWMIGQVLDQLAKVVLLQGDLATAWALLEESARCLEASGDRAYLSHTMVGQATILRLRGEYERASVIASSALPLGESPGHQSQPYWALEELGLIASAQGEFDLARQHLETSLVRSEERGDRFANATLLADLGLVARAEGGYGRARALLGESLAIHQTLGTRVGEASCLGNLGVVALNEGKLEEAGSLLRESLALRREIGDRGGIATLLESFGGLAALRAQPERALRLLGAGSRIREEIGSVAPPVWRKQRDPWLERARQSLDPSASAAAWAEGQAMTLEEAVEYALRDDEA